jgi:catecholate siderophore receptor
MSLKSRQSSTAPTEAFSLRSFPATAALALANGLLLTGAAEAQSTNTPPASGGSATNTPAKIPTVVVTGQGANPYQPDFVSSPKYTAPLRDIPQTITVVPRQLIEEQGATTLRDVLRNVPGISLQAGEGGVPAGDNLSIRGNSARTDLFIDGIRDFGGYSRDAFNLEQVEITKGPSSATSGRGSTGGSVNLVSKSPKLDPSYQGSLGFGTEDYKRATLDLNQPLGSKDGKGLPNAAVRLNMMWHDAETPGRDTVENNRWGVAPSVAFGLNTPTRVTASYFHLAQDNVPDYGIPWVTANNTNAVLAAYRNAAPPVNFDNFYGIKSRDYEKTDTDIGTVQLDHDFNSRMSLRSAVRYGQTTRDSVITAPRFVDLNPSPTNIQESATINRQIQSRDQKDSIWASQNNFTASFDTGRIQHDTTSGFELSRESSKNHLRTGTTSTTDIFNPNPYAPSPGSVARTGAYNDATADAFALYAFDTVKLSDKWQLNGGLRWDYFDAKVDSVAANGVVTPMGRVDRMFSWRTGLVFKPRPNGSIYLGYGTSFNPSIEGLTASTNLTAANNINLPPEKNRSFELGTKWDFFDQRLAVNTAIFRTDKTNARTDDGVGSTPDPVVLEGETRVQGAELSVAGNVTKNWTLSAAYTFQDSEVLKSKNPLEAGNEVNNTPQNSFTLWTTYKLPCGFELGGGPQYVGSRYNSSNAGTRRQAPGYWTWDAMLAYQVNKHVTLRLNVYNLADEDYIGSLGGGHFIPGSGRYATLTASFKF